MRKIKFRAWDKIDKQMFDDFHLDCEENLSYIADGGCSDIGKHPLMQFTGLHDKNRNEIYEGDILRVNCRFNREDKFTGIVNFTNGAWHIGYSDLYCFHVQPYDIEIIGNIYESPELFENKQ